MRLRRTAQAVPAAAASTQDDASPATLGGARHPHATVILISIGLAMVFGVAGPEVATHTHYARLAFFLGVGAGAAFAVAVMLMSFEVTSYFSAAQRTQIRR